MSIKSNLPSVIEAVKKAEPLVVKAAALGMQKGALQFIGKIKREQMSGRPGLNAPTGTLRRSWYERTVIDGTNTRVTIATASKYARPHQYGTTIRPKNAQALAIPISKEAQGRSPRDFNDLRLIPRPGKYPLLVRDTYNVKKKTGAEYKQRTLLMFALKKSVTMPKRLHVIEDFSKSGTRIIGQQIVKQVALALKGQPA